MKKEIELKRFLKRIARENKKERERRITFILGHGRSAARQSDLRDPDTGELSYHKVIDHYMPRTVKELLQNRESVFHISKVELRAENRGTGEIVLPIPTLFSIVKQPEVVYEFLADVLAVTLFGKFSWVRFDFSKAERIDVGAQVLLDILLMDVIRFLERCREQTLLRKKFPLVKKRIGPINLETTRGPVLDILRSIGSLVVLGREKHDLPNVVPCTLISSYRDPRLPGEKAEARKELHTTQLLQYVVDSLSKVGKKLTRERLDNLGIVIGEALINAEEHSSTSRRFSIGYFRLDDSDPDNVGIFRLAILNFGSTIYEKFASPECENPKIVAQMRKLSEKYTSKGFFNQGKFDEEQLWTLYALQEGVTSLDPNQRRRGKGTIRYIENFFNIKGSSNQDQISRMTLLSGNTRITFDGKYRIMQPKGADGLKIMTFNKSNTLQKPPDHKYVESSQSYFPGVFISARILLQKDDVK